jgi:tRNA U38,U39,U40 pseudouridine synthase TruA
MVSLEHIEKLLERKIEMVDKDKAPAEGLALLDIIYDDSVFLYNDKMEKSVESEYIYYRQSLKNNSK